MHDYSVPGTRRILIAVLVLCTAGSRIAAEEGAPDITLRYAEEFRVTRLQGCTEVRVGRDRRYLLVPRGGTVPGGSEDALVIRTPVRRVAVFSGVPLSSFGLLAKECVVAAVERYGEVAPEEIRKGIAAGEIAELQPGEYPDMGLLLDLEPDAVLVTPETGEPVRKWLLELNLPVLVYRGAEEAHPLGTAEWITLTGLLTGREEEAAGIFDFVASEYNRLKSRAGEDGPLVVAGAPAGDAWTAPGEESLTARLIADAGGRYLWSGRRGRGHVRIPLEEALEIARHAEVWIRPGEDWESYADALEADEGIADFASFQGGRTYTGGKRKTATGANDLDDTGSIVPSSVLADLVRIFFPGRLEDGGLTYFEGLTWE